MSSTELNQALLLFLVVVSVLAVAVAVAARVYLVNWLGERAGEKRAQPLLESVLLRNPASFLA